MKIELWQADNGKWYWHFKARNGRIMAQSQGYTHKHGAKQTLAAIETYYRDDTVKIVELDHE